MIVASVFRWGNAVRLQLEMLQLLVTNHYFPFVSLTSIGGKFKSITSIELALTFVIPCNPNPAQHDGIIEKTDPQLLACFFTHPAGDFLSFRRAQPVKQCNDKNKDNREINRAHENTAEYKDRALYYTGRLG